MQSKNAKSFQSDLLDLDPIKLDEYCDEKGKLFAEGEPKLDKQGRPEKDKYGNDIMINKVTTGQLRNVFAKITSIRAQYRNMGSKTWKEQVQQVRRELVMLKPMLAYAKGRDQNLQNFVSEMRDLISKTVSSLDIEIENNRESVKFHSLDNFFSIVEGFIAYHKYHKGKE